MRRRTTPTRIPIQTPQLAALLVIFLLTAANDERKRTNCEGVSLGKNMID